MSECVELETRQSLIEHLKSTSYEYTIMKFTASWCGPCQKVQPELDKILDEMNTKFSNSPNKFEFFHVDVDDNFDLFAFLKSKKMVKGIPTIFLYKKTSYTANEPEHIYVPQSSISGTNVENIRALFSLVV